MDISSGTSELSFDDSLRDIRPIYHTQASPTHSEHVSQNYDSTTSESAGETEFNIAGVDPLPSDFGDYHPVEPNILKL